MTDLDLGFPIWVRATHWFNVLFMTLLIRKMVKFLRDRGGGGLPHDRRGDGRRPRGLPAVRHGGGDLIPIDQRRQEENHA